MPSTLPDTPILLWTLASLAAGWLSWWLLWLALKLDARSSHRLQSILTSAPGRWLGRLLRLTWLILPGYAALLQGVASPRLMGLEQIDWGAAFGQGLLFVLISWGVLLAAGLSYRRNASTSQTRPSPALAIASSAWLLAEAGALQWHWAFYRNATLAVTAGTGWEQASYWGTWLAAGLAVLQGALNPFLWRDLRNTDQAGGRILRAVLLLAGSVLYLISRNFWLTWALHALPAALLEPRLSRWARKKAGSHASPPPARRFGNR